MKKLQEFWKTGKNGKLLILIGGFIVLCMLCAVVGSFLPSPSKPTPTTDVNAIYTAAVLTVQAPYTQTAAAFTPTSSITPRPTFTITPPPSPTATQAPLVLTGTGDNVIDVKKWEGPALLKVKYEGGGNFAIFNYGADNQKIDLLINTIGSYQGTVPLDFLDVEQTTRFEITASGPWELDILPFEQMRGESIPGTIQGTGDDIIFLKGGKPDLLKADATKADGNFAIWSYSTNGRDLVVNEIAPYSGTVLLDPDTKVLVIQAEKQWSIEITTR